MNLINLAVGCPLTFHLAPPGRLKMCWLWWNRWMISSCIWYPKKFFSVWCMAAPSASSGKSLNFSERRWCCHCFSFSGNQSHIRWAGPSEEKLLLALSDGNSHNRDTEVHLRKQIRSVHWKLLVSPSVTLSLISLLMAVWSALCYHRDSSCQWKYSMFSFGAQVFHPCALMHKKNVMWPRAQTFCLVPSLSQITTLSSGLVYDHIFAKLTLPPA